MNKLIIATLIALISISLSAQELTKGIWMTGDDNTKIETYEKDGTWYGKIISSDNPKAVIGLDILQNFIYESGTWKGKLYAAKKGKLLDAVIIPATDKLNISVSAGLFKKKFEWFREDSTN